MRRPVPVSSRQSILASIPNLVASWTIVGATFFCTAIAYAQTTPLGTPISTWVPNGSVSGLALDGDVLYIGGEFDQVNLPTGPFASVDAATGSTATAGAGLRGSVTAIQSDGAGGWYVATGTGLFNTAAAHVDHVLPDGRIDPAWTPPEFSSHPPPPPPARGSIVTTLSLEGGRLFAGGAFAAVNGALRAGLVALDPASGGVLPWTADLTFTLGTAAPAVTGVAASPGRLFISGLFSHVGGTARGNFAVVDTATGAVLPPALPVINGSLGPPAIAGNRVYVYGACRTSLYEMCAYDLDLVPLPGWTFPFSNVLLAAMTASDSAVFATQFNADFPHTERTVKLDPATGAEMPWAEVSTVGGNRVLTVAGSRLYLAGQFTTVNGQERTRLAAVDATTGVLEAWAPLVGAPVTAVTVQGNAVAFGGIFNGAGGIRKRNLVAIDLRTGHPATPNTPDLPVAATAFQKIGDVMVVAGGENSVVSPAQPNVQAFSISAGVLLPWSLTTNGSVSALAADAQRLYLGGAFSSISGIARSNVAAVDLRTATLSAWNATAELPVRTLAVAHGALYAGGGFGGYAGGGGEPRNYVAAFDLGSGATLPFSPRPAMVFTSGLAFHQDRVLLVGGSADALEWVDSTSGRSVPPASNVSGYGYGVAQRGDTIFVSGTTGTGDGAVVVIDAPTGRLDIVPVAGVYGPIAVNDTYVALAGAVFRRPGPGAPRGISATVANSAVTLGWQAGSAPVATSFVVEAGTSSGAADVGVFPVGLATAVTGTLLPGTYFTRIRGIGAGGVGAASSEAIVTVPATSAPPNVPGTLSAAVTGGVVNLQWGAASGNATTYVVEAGSASGLTDIGTFAPGHLDTSLTTPAPPGTYFVRVRAANAFGASPASNEVTVVVP
jgi:hypothetical protein